jgi:NitT/TauT family transport system substrate-binding protein
VAASVAASAAARPASDVIKISYAQPVAATAALWMAQDNGAFKKAGLNTEVVRIAPPADIQAMVGGDTQFAFGGTGAMSATAAGANLKFLAITTGVYLQSVWADSTVQKVSDLAGKSIGATTKGGPSDFALHTVLKREGVDASKVNILYLRDDNANVAALESGQIPAAILTSPNNLRARQAGFHLLLDMIPLKIPTVTQGIFVRADWAQQHQDAVLAFLRTYLESVKIDKTDATAAKASITKNTGIDDQAIVDESYRATLGGLATIPVPRDEQFQNILDLTDDQAMKTRKPSDFYDSSYLQKLDGFVQSLYPNGIPAD